MRYLLFLWICLFTALKAQFTITLKYKSNPCGGKRNQDTTKYFLFTNKKWILQYPSGKIDTIISDVNGKIKIPSKKGTYLLFEPWKYYKTAPSDFPKNLYNQNCLNTEYSKPDFQITITSNKKFHIQPLYITPYCIDKHPCLRTDTIIPRIPRQ